MNVTLNIKLPHARTCAGMVLLAALSALIWFGLFGVNPVTVCVVLYNIVGAALLLGAEEDANEAEQSKQAFNKTKGGKA